MINNNIDNYSFSEVRIPLADIKELAKALGLKVVSADMDEGEFILLEDNQGRIIHKLAVTWWY